MSDDVKDFVRRVDAKMVARSLAGETSPQPLAFKVAIEVLVEDLAKLVARVEALEAVAHPPIDLEPAIVEILARRFGLAPRCKVCGFVNPIRHVETVSPSMCPEHSR